MKQNTLGERIKYHRKKCGLTQEQLAERMGVSPQAVSKWENDLSCPDISALPGLADLFGISVDELLGREAPRYEAEPETGGESHVLRTYRYDGLLFALYVLCVGALLTCNALFHLPVGAWTVIWTLALVFCGVSALCRKFSLSGAALVLAGLYFLLRRYFPVIELRWATLLPACVLLWGVSLLLDVLRGQRREKHTAHTSQARVTRCKDGEINYALCFGECCAKAVTRCLRGGRIKTAFGKFTVDLSGCAALAPECRVAVNNSFGELTLLVPARFAVQAEGNGAASVLTTDGAPDAEPSGVLQLQVENAFGMIKLRYI